MSGLLRFRGVTLDAWIPGTGPFDVPAVAVPASVALVPLICFGHEVLRARRVRARHRGVLDMVGRRSARPRAFWTTTRPRPTACPAAGRGSW
ncbi:hypothetical protein [Streptomyces sp. 5-10]|nr:hypothetical protein [Streptomyces sp. 5-10]